jgi:hypothetical protein
LDELLDVVVMCSSLRVQYATICIILRAALC